MTLRQLEIPHAVVYVKLIEYAALKPEKKKNQGKIKVNIGFILHYSPITVIAIKA